MANETRAPADVARAVFDAIGNHNLDMLREVVPPDGVDDFVAVGEFRGPDAIWGFFAEMFAAFPDFSITIDQIVPGESVAAVQWHASGTFTGGAFQGIHPTGRRVELRGVDVMEISGGLVRRNTIYFDGASMARQIGMLPRRDSPADRAMLVAFNARTRLAGQVKAMRERRR
jgi:predicted ester cyclase